MKTLYFYLIARLKGKKISWTQAKAEGNRISVSDTIEEKIDSALLQVTSFFSFIKNVFITKGMFNLDRLFQYIYSKMLRSFFGRLSICFVRNRVDYVFLFKGVS